MHRSPPRGLSVGPKVRDNNHHICHRCNIFPGIPNGVKGLFRSPDGCSGPTPLTRHASDKSHRRQVWE